MRDKNNSKTDHNRKKRTVILITEITESVFSSIQIGKLKLKISKFNVKGEIEMKRFLIPAIAIALALTACSSPSADTSSASGSTSAASSSKGKNMISGFDGIEWGTSQDDISGSVSGLSEIDTGIDGLTALSGDGSIQALPANVTYCFGSDGLETIGYELTDTMTDDQYQSLCDAIIEDYGQAAASKNSTGWGKCSVWVDSDKDFAYISQMGEIALVKNGSAFTDKASETLQEFHEIDLDSILGK